MSRSEETWAFSSSLNGATLREVAVDRRNEIEALDTQIAEFASRPADELVLVKTCKDGKPVKLAMKKAGTLLKQFKRTRAELQDDLERWREAHRVLEQALAKVRSMLDSSV